MLISERFFLVLVLLKKLFCKTKNKDVSVFIIIKKSTLLTRAQL